MSNTRLMQVSEFLRKAEPALTDKELDYGIETLIFIRDSLSCMSGYQLAVRALNADIETLRSIKFVRSIT